MKLARKVADLESVDEHLRPLYKESDGGGFELIDIQLEGTVPEDDVAGLRQNRDDILAEYKKFKAKFEGIDPDKYTEFEKVARDAAKKANEKKGDLEALERQIREEYEKKLAKITEDVTRHKDTIQKLMIDNVATSALASAKGNVKLLLPHVKNACRCVEDGGEWKVEVLGVDGRPRVSPGKASELMGITELVEEMKSSDDFAAGFEGSNATGGGAAESVATGSGRFVLRGDDRKDPAKFRAMKDAAEKAGAEVQLAES